MLPRISSAAHHLSPPAVIVHLHQLSPPAVIVHLNSAVCVADQAIFGNEIPLRDPLSIELFHYHMLNVCLLALNFRSQKSIADSVAAEKPSFPAG